MFFFQKILLIKCFFWVMKCGFKIFFIRKNLIKGTSFQHPYVVPSNISDVSPSLRWGFADLESQTTRVMKSWLKSSSNFSTWHDDTWWIYDMIWHDMMDIYSTLRFLKILKLKVTTSLPRHFWSILFYRNAASLEWCVQWLWSWELPTGWPARKSAGEESRNWMLFQKPTQIYSIEKKSRKE